MRTYISFLLLSIFTLFSLGSEVSTVALAKKNKASTTVEPSEKNFKIGLKAYNDKSYDEAIDAFLQSIYFARNNYQPKAYYYLGMCYVAQNNDIKAIDAFKKCSEQTLEPIPDAKIELGKIYTKQKRLNEAMTVANEALCESGANGYRAQNLLGVIMECMGDLDSAKWHFEQALGTRPWTYTSAWENLIENAIKRKQYGEAVSNINALLTNEKPLKNVDFERVHLDLGLCYFAKGNLQGAIDAWHRVLDYNANNKDAHIQLAVLYDSEKHYSSVKERRNLCYEGVVSVSLVVDKNKTIHSISVQEHASGIRFNPKWHDTINNIETIVNEKFKSINDINDMDLNHETELLRQDIIRSIKSQYFFKPYLQVLITVI